MHNICIYIIIHRSVFGKTSSQVQLSNFIKIHVCITLPSRKPILYNFVVARELDQFRIRYKCTMYSSHCSPCVWIG